MSVILWDLGLGIRGCEARSTAPAPWNLGPRTRTLAAKRVDGSLQRRLDAPLVFDFGAGRAHLRLMFRSGFQIRLLTHAGRLIAGG